jgi:hypothetical protein
VAGVKLIAVAWVFGRDAATGVLMAGGDRMYGSLPAFAAWQSVPEQLVGSIGVLAPGLPMLAAGMLLLSLGLGLITVLRRPEQPLLLLLASCLPILGWFLLFQQHTAIHASFMARILVWPLIAGFAVFAWSLVRESSGLLSDGSARLPAGTRPLP